MHPFTLENANKMHGWIVIIQNSDVESLWKTINKNFWILKIDEQMTVITG